MATASSPDSNKLCHVFSLSLVLLLVRLLRRIELLALCLLVYLPAFVCVYGMFSRYICFALWHAHCNAFQKRLLLPVLYLPIVVCCCCCLLGNFITCPQSMWGSLSLTLALAQSYTARSHQLRHGRPFWCVRMSERACQTERVERARAVSERRRSVAAKMKKGLSVASTFTPFQLLSCAWSFCLVLVCARQIATRAVCWPTKKLHTLVY